MFSWLGFRKTGKKKKKKGWILESELGFMQRMDLKGKLSHQYKMLAFNMSVKHWYPISALQTC